MAPVGVIGMASRLESLLARSQSRIGDIELAPGRHLKPGHRFITTESLNEGSARAAVQELRDEGVRVIVATSAFSVDDNTAEETVRRAANEIGIPVTCGPRDFQALWPHHPHPHGGDQCLDPAQDDRHRHDDRAERARGGHLGAVMIMRGDGGVMDIQEMRRRPAMTMLSGPAASVAGRADASAHLRWHLFSRSAAPAPTSA